MVEKEGRYHVPPLKGFWEVIQGDPLYPIIFNVGVYAVLQQWVMVVAE